MTPKVLSRCLSGMNHHRPINRIAVGPTLSTKLGNARKDIPRFYLEIAVCLMSTVLLVSQSQSASAQTYAAPNESAPVAVPSSADSRPVGGAVIPTGQHKRTKRDLLFLAIGVGAAEWDAASTYSLFRREPGEYQEANPLQRPFVGTGLGYVTAPTDVTVSWLIATHVRGKWKRRVAWAVFWGSTAAHLYAASHNYTLH